MEGVKYIYVVFGKMGGIPEDIRAYARKIHPDGRLWWIEDKVEDAHTLPIQARDLFSAGSVANPNNDDNEGIYIERALKLIEEDMKRAALEMDDAIFVEYWGESVPPEKRISRWLEMADEFARDWKPSDSLFKE